MNKLQNEEGVPVASSLPEQWDDTQVPLTTQTQHGHEAKRVSVTMSLSLIVVMAAILVGLSVWGCMYGLNLRGYDYMAERVAQDQLAMGTTVLRAFFKTPSSAMSALAEEMRLNLLSGAITLAQFRNPQYVLSQYWTPSKLSASAQYIGYADGGSTGYGIYANGTAVLNNAIIAANGTISAFAVDPVFGNPVSLLGTGPFDSRLRPWYLSALKNTSLMGVTSPYVSADAGAIVVAGSQVLFSDYRPLATIPAPYTVNASAEPSTIIAVFAYDLSLNQISVSLNSTVTLSGGESWIFSGETADAIAYTNLRVTGFVPIDGRPPKITQIPSAVVNASMRYALAQNGIAENDYRRYRDIAPFFNAEISAKGVVYLSSCQPAVLPSGDIWQICVATPKSTYYAGADYATMVSLLIIFLVIFPISGTCAALAASGLFAHPAIELAAGMAAIEAFSGAAHNVSKTSRIREIFLMQSAFNSMRRALDGFAKFAPVHVVKKLLAEGVEAKLGVEEIQTTAFFSDIEGFTTISEREPPEKLIATLAEYFNAMTATVLARNGIVGDFIGDAVFAFWNAPAAREARHAFLACDAAMEQQEQLVRLRAEWIKRGLPAFKIRIGINTGPCLAGNVGSEMRLKYTLIGDTVNLAARLEGIGKYYHVNLVVSVTTYTAPGVREAFVGRVLDVVQVVGKKEPTKILTLVARRQAATEDQLAAERRSWDMIGAYTEGRLQEARDLLAQLEVLLPGDYSVQLMVAKVMALQKTGLPADWTGATAMTEK